MFGIFNRNEQPIEAPEPSIERLLAEAAQFTGGTTCSFECLLADALQLRKAVLAKLDGLSSDGKATVLSHVHELSLQLHKGEGVPPETLPFGSLHPVPPEQARLVLDEIGFFITDAEQNGNELRLLAGAYCQSMAMACLAGSMEKGLEQELELINLKHELGQQTGRLMDSLQQG